MAELLAPSPPRNLRVADASLSGIGTVVNFDFEEATALSKALDKAADKPLSGDNLSIAAMKMVWRASGKEVVREAVKIAPQSGLKNEYTWRRKQYSYRGKHGDLRRMAGYAVKPYRTGKGVRVLIGDTTTDRKKLAGMVGKMATYNTRRQPPGTPGTSKVGPYRFWLPEANEMTMPKHVPILVETFNRAKQRQVAQIAEKEKTKRKVFANADFVVKNRQRNRLLMDSNRPGESYAQTASRLGIPWG